MGYVPDLPPQLRDAAANLNGTEPGDPGYTPPDLRGQLLAAADGIESAAAAVAAAGWLEWWGAAAELQHRENVGAGLLTRYYSATGTVPPGLLATLGQAGQILVYGATALLLGAWGLLLYRWTR